MKVKDPAIPHCDQCEAAMINGVFCHETGCPNEKSRWDSDEQTWIPTRVCFECGCLVDAADECCNAEDYDDVDAIDHGPCGDWTA